MKSIQNYLIIIFLTLSIQVSATTVHYKSLDNLVDESTNILKGVVSNIQFIKHEKDIYTLVTLSNASFITDTGEEVANKDLTLRFFGGFLDGVGMAYNGTPQFELGQKIIAFTKDNGTSVVPIIGWEQGILNIDKTNRLTDYSGNKILGMKGKHFIKENLTTSKLQIVNNKTINSNPGPIGQQNKQLFKTPISRKAMSSAILISKIKSRLTTKMQFKNKTMSSANLNTISFQQTFNNKIMSDRDNLYSLPPIITSQSRNNATSTPLTSK